jgi:uncharacterized protein
MAIPGWILPFFFTFPSVLDYQMTTSPRNELLIIFYRNPELGKVKTRLGSSIGSASALAIYYRLAAHTRTITEELAMDRMLYYSEYIDKEDMWSDEVFLKALQGGGSLGDKMKAAFKQGFDSGYSSIIIIGTDCYELTSAIINEAFRGLEDNDIVLGPAKDGGYYLLGMKTLHSVLFENKIWSSDTVFTDTLKDCRNLSLRVHLLQTLTDIDNFKDLPPEWRSRLG